MDRKKVVLYSDWFEAERFYYQHKDMIEIEYCIADLENEYKIKSFHGKPILSLDVSRIKRENELIVVCGNSYSEKRDTLSSAGLQEFRHFLPGELLDRKMVIVHGNCYCVPLIKYLLRIKEFAAKYYIYPVPLICYNSEGRISDELLEHCDIFIHQNIHTKQYGEQLTDEWIVPRLPEQCREISIPNFMGIYDGGCFFFPQCLGYKDNKRKLIIHEKNFFNYRDCFIEECLDAGTDADEIAKRIQGDMVFDKVLIDSVFQNSMLDLLEREKKWDVKISDYFLDTYKKKQFFLDSGHPADHVIKEIAVRTVQKLGIFIKSNDLKDLGKEWLNDNEIPIYQCVKDSLHLEWQNQFLREDTRMTLAEGNMDVREYVKEYIYFSEYAECCVDEYNKNFLCEWKKKGRLIVFGAGNWFRNYMLHYGEEYPPDFIADNDTAKQGTEVKGIRIIDPRNLLDTDKVIICNASARQDIEKQLLTMGIKNYAFYKPDGFIEQADGDTCKK